MIDCTKTENYLKERKRMSKDCKISCFVCPLGSINNGENKICHSLERDKIEKSIAIVQKWSDEHPQKTMLDDVLENFPKAKKEDVVDNVCPDALGYESESCCEDHCGSCAVCWNRPYEEEAE